MEKSNRVLLYIGVTLVAFIVSTGGVGLHFHFSATPANSESGRAVIGINDKSFLASWRTIYDRMAEEVALYPNDWAIKTCRIAARRYNLAARYSDRPKMGDLPYELDEGNCNDYSGRTSLH